MSAAAATVSRAQALAQANALARRSRLSTTPTSFDTASTSPSVLSTTYGVRSLTSACRPNDEHVALSRLANICGA